MQRTQLGLSPSVPPLQHRAEAPTRRGWWAALSKLFGRPQSPKGQEQSHSEVTRVESRLALMLVPASEVWRGSCSPCPARRPHGRRRRLSGPGRGLICWVYPGFPIRLGALPGFVVGDRMWKALWKLVENEQRFPRRGGRVLCVHGAGSSHRARPCVRLVCRPGRHEGSLEPYRQNCDESGLQISPPGPLRRHALPDRGQPRYSCTDSEPFAYPVR